MWTAPLGGSRSLFKMSYPHKRGNVKTLKLLATLLALFIVAALLGCSDTTKSPDVSDGIRKSLDKAGLQGVSVSQDRDKGVITLGGHIPYDRDKSQAESIAKSIAGGQTRLG